MALFNPLLLFHLVRGKIGSQWLTPKEMVLEDKEQARLYEKTREY